MMGSDLSKNTGNENDEKILKTISELINIKKQIILYGPPGTGKTYLANKFIQLHSTSKNTEPDEIISDKNVFFLTIFPFNKITSEDSILRNYPEDDYGRIPTLNTGDQFKYFWETKHGKINFQCYFDEIKNGDIALTYFALTEKRFTTAAKCIEKGSNYLIFEVIQQFLGPTYQEMKNDYYLKDHLAKGSFSFTLKKIKPEELERIIALSGDLEYETLDLKKPDGYRDSEVRSTNSEFVTFHPSFGYEDFIEGLRPVTDESSNLRFNVEDGIFKEISRRAFNDLLNKSGIEKKWGKSGDIPQLTDSEREIVKKRAPDVPYYLIIDEINRGDMSRIFGELITLLEADKRYSENNQLITRLPNSKTAFSVPPNLFIIGTMNTADKSIALVDIALRRRFGFIEIMPDHDFLHKYIRNSNPEINEITEIASNLLKTINQKIISNYGRDHQIGHSYMIKLKDAKSRDKAIKILHFAWYHEIIPLLQEYYYDSPGRSNVTFIKQCVTLRAHARFHSYFMNFNYVKYILI
ncbi:MAG: AAA family ATPase [Euryarchaeota archaeon]|nr:AAA family ATPase [Euryarchaeota archaeon]